MVVQILLLVFGAIIAVPALVLFVECMAALFARKVSEISNGTEQALPARIGVLISAHNEELLIEATVRSIVRQLRAGDELLVVADNCTDNTAALARSAGATVIERHDLSQRGKGYGLAFGVAHLRKNPPDVVILFDADIVVDTGVIARLAREAAEHGRPIQALYLQKAPKDARPRDTISALAFLVKNAVRPAGLDRLGVPCALTGSGMAFTWGLIEKAPLASGHLVEDMELGLNFLRGGEGAKVLSGGGDSGRTAQRQPCGVHSAHALGTWTSGDHTGPCGAVVDLGCDAAALPVDCHGTGSGGSAIGTIGGGVVCGSGGGFWRGALSEGLGAGHGFRRIGPFDWRGDFVRLAAACPAASDAGALGDSAVCALESAPLLWISFQTPDDLGTHRPNFGQCRWSKHHMIVERRKLQSNIALPRLDTSAGGASAAARVSLSVRAGGAYYGRIMPRLRPHVGPKRTFLNAVPLDAITEEECVESILKGLDEGRGGFVVTHNLDHLRRLDHDPAFAAICAGADLRVADGMPVVWLSRLLRMRVPERVAGSSLIHTLSEAAAKCGRTVYLLGGDEGTAEAAAATLQSHNPTLKVVGAYCVPFGFEKNEVLVTEMVRQLKAAKPDIVYVALGSPKQEILIARLRKHLPDSWWLGVGISFSYVCGKVRRAPQWVQKVGAEWMYRMVQEPRRLVKRYLGDGVPFAMRLASRCMADYLKGDVRKH